MTTLIQRNQHLKPGPPTAEIHHFDSQIAEAQHCPRCHHGMRYEAYHTQGPGLTRYIALSVCTNCSYQREF